MKQIRLLLAAFTTMVIAGCASNPMQVSGSQYIGRPQPDESQVVFMRGSRYGNIYKASLYDVTDEEPVFIGIIANGTKILYRTTPGKHTFMVVSEAADFMEADLLAGKTYYSIVTGRLGVAVARFSLWPIRTDGTTRYNTSASGFEQWKNSLSLVSNTVESEQWNRNNIDSVKAKQADYWPVWQRKSADDLAERTLNPQDGLEAF